MIRYTTPIHNFELLNLNAEIKKIRVTYAQNNKEIITKTEDDVMISDNNVLVQLTQEESALFRTGYDIQVQIRVLDSNNVVQANEIFYIPIHKVLNEEIL